MSDDFVPDEVIQERFERLIALQDRISLERNTEQLGLRLEVLSEGPSRKDPSVATTRSRSGKLVHVPGTWDAGEFMDVDVVQARPHYLIGSAV